MKQNTFHLNDSFPLPLIMQYSPSFLTGNLLDRYAEIHLINGNLMDRYSDNFVNGNLLDRYAEIQYLTGSLSDRYRDLSAAFVAAIGTQLPLPSTSYGIPIP